MSSLIRVVVVGAKRLLLKIGSALELTLACTLADKVRGDHVGSLSCEILPLAEELALCKRLTLASDLRLALGG